ncbi:MAG: 3-oxoacyl-[acyl-carrier-protein] reductase [Brevinema sp.]
MKKLQDKIAIITGSSTGIGLCIAKNLAKNGADIVLSSSSIKADDPIADQISKTYGVRVMIIPADVSKYDDVVRLIETTHKEWGRIDILVNNAGITRDNLILRMSPEDFDKVIDVHLKGVFYGIKAAYSIMMKQRYGKIINIASVVGLVGNAGQANYAAAKAGIIALTKSAAKELAGRGVNVNAIAPGFTETKMTDTIPENEKSKILLSIPMKRMAQPKEIASVVSFLASDDASYITGQTITVDGGMVM